MENSVRTGVKRVKREREREEGQITLRRDNGQGDG